MVAVSDALHAAARSPAAPAPVARRALVVGGAGALGASVLEHLLDTRGFERVGALVNQPLRAAMSRFEAVADDDAALQAFGADTALVVFDRARHAFGREAAFVRPAPEMLAACAQRLRRAGVRTLLVVVPHTPSLLPMALQRGLANLDEAAVAALRFEHVLFMRMAQSSAAPDPGARSAPQRLAAWMLSQLRWMVPQREQPVRPATVARVAVALALQLPSAAAGTRVMPAAWLWQAAQRRDLAAAVSAWLHDEAR